jgi:CRISPR-associated endonuclease/helicase Cas3
MLIAHSKNAQGKRHDLVEHLKSVAESAAMFASKFEARELGYWAGMWHDVGKVHPEFQKYLNDCEADPDHRHRGPDHKRAGALLAAQRYDVLAFLIAGHHGGLPGRSELKTWLQDKTKIQRSQDAIQLIRQHVVDIEPVQALSLPAHLKSELDTEFFIRMLFSTLVDADFLDTEKHFDAEQSDRRSSAPTSAELWDRFDRNQQMLSGKKTNRLNQIRHDVYQACTQAASQIQGFFRLTVPTGGGKTRSAMAFALKHMLAHGLDRVIVAIPYTSIIDQTAKVYREIFGDGTVVEHHSAVAMKEDAADPISLSDVWSRLAAENWDAPIIVTTTVQLFESLFGRKTTACRKLHNIAKTVIVLDEVQTLPVGLLDPILDGLRQLVAHFKVSVVLCTATQPALEDSPYLKGLPSVTEIIPDPAGLFVELSSRVRYELPSLGVAWTWEQVAAEMSQAEQALAVVNTKNNGLALLEALQDPKALHLSTLLCGAHRRDVLKEVDRRLEQAIPCRLVSTQVLEAGVDLDFPLVLRAMGPLDRIVQAAGRCNREGKQVTGRVVVFEPAEGQLPPGAYASATATTRNLLVRTDFKFHQPENYREYFQALYQVVETDAKEIQKLRERFDFPGVEERFRMIDDDSVSVVVRYRGIDDGDETVDRLISYLQHQEGKIPRWLLRQLQPYIVNVRFRLVDGYQQSGLLQELTPGLWEWLGKYDLVRGITVGNRNPDELVV